MPDVVLEQRCENSASAGAAAEAPLVPRQKGSDKISKACFDERVGAAMKALDGEGGGPLRFFEDVLQLLGVDDGLKDRLTNHILDSLRKAHWTPSMTAGQLSNLIGQALSRDGGLCLNRIGSTLRLVFMDKPHGSYLFNSTKRDLTEGELGVARTEGGTLRLMRLFDDGRVHWTDAGGVQGVVAQVKSDWIVNLAAMRK